MKDRLGKRIIAGSKIKCVNDIEECKIYKVEKFYDTQPILGVNVEGTFFALGDFNTDENGCLVDFERL